MGGFGLCFLVGMIGKLRWIVLGDLGSSRFLGGFWSDYPGECHGLRTLDIWLRALAVLGQVFVVVASL